MSFLVLRWESKFKDNLTFTVLAIQVACAPGYRGVIWGHTRGCQVAWLLLLGTPSGPRATQRCLEVLLCEAEQDAPESFSRKLLDFAMTGRTDNTSLTFSALFSGH